MTESEILFWKRAAQDLGLEIVAPFELTLPDGSRLVATALIKNFGPKNGMVVVEDYRVVKPHGQALLDCGYGYSTVSSNGQYNRSSIIEVLADWGWNGILDQKPDWLSEEFEVGINIPRNEKGG